MKCPVCNNGVKKSEQICSVCGFRYIKTVVVTEEDYHPWMDDTVIPCRTIYEKQCEELVKLNKELLDLKKENEKLKKKQILSGRTLSESFSNNGFEVIGKRPSGGCLWVVGSKAKLETYLTTAKSLFHMGDNGFSSGRATSNRTGWYTNSND